MSGSSPLDDLGVHVALNLPGLLVVDEVRVESQVHEAHGVSLRRDAGASGLRADA